VLEFEKSAFLQAFLCLFITFLQAIQLPLGVIFKRKEGVRIFPISYILVGLFFAIVPLSPEKRITSIIWILASYLVLKIMMFKKNSKSLFLTANYNIFNDNRKYINLKRIFLSIFV
jgi:hypothetical protein